MWVLAAGGVVEVTGNRRPLGTAGKPAVPFCCIMVWEIQYDASRHIFFETQ